MRAPTRQPQQPVENGESGHAHGAAMPRGRAFVMAASLLIGLGLLRLILYDQRRLAQANIRIWLCLWLPTERPRNQ